jgi:hypothetical protein
MSRARNLVPRSAGAPTPLATTGAETGGGVVGCGGGGIGIPLVPSPCWSGPWSVMVPSVSVYALPTTDVNDKGSRRACTLALELSRTR